MALIATEGANNGTSLIMMVVWIVGLIIMFYFLMIRPQKKEEKRKNVMLSNMEIGDVVVTTSGFYGVLIDITETDAIVEFGSNKNCRIPMKKSAIVEVEKPDSGE